METKLSTKIIVFCILIFSGCDNNQDQTPAAPPIDLISTDFPEAKQEIMDTWIGIEQSLRDGDIDKLISFHGYSPKFTEFKNGAAVNGSEANEAFERAAFGAVTEVVKFDTKDLKISVYGDVANMAFQSDFHLKFGEDLVVINEQTTLLFVKTQNGWKIVHEHHSPWIME